MKKIFFLTGLKRSKFSNTIKKMLKILGYRSWCTTTFGFRVVHHKHQWLGTKTYQKLIYFTNLHTQMIKTNKTKKKLNFKQIIALRLTASHLKLASKILFF